MWYLILTIIYLLAYLLEAVIPLPLILVFLIAQASFDRIKPTAVFSLFGGLLTDLVLVRPLGTTSLFFLLTTLLIQAYRRKFREESLSFLFIFTVIITGLYFWLFANWQLFFIVKSLICAVLAVFATAILYNLHEK